MMMNDYQAIQEQLDEAHADAHELTEYEQIQFEREYNAWWDAIAEDDWQNLFGRTTDVPLSMV